MSKIFGFFLSAAIIILCLTLNVYYYPDVIRQGVVKATDESTTAETTENTDDLRPLDRQKETKTQETPSETENDVKSDSNSNDKNDATEDAKNEKESVSASVENNLLNVSVASNRNFSNAEKDEKSSDSDVPEGASGAQSNAEKPQGGKYVSIPSVEVDAFRSRFGSNSCRVVGVARASVAE